MTKVAVAWMRIKNGVTSVITNKAKEDPIFEAVDPEYTKEHNIAMYNSEFSDIHLLEGLTPEQIKELEERFKL